MLPLTGSQAKGGVSMGLFDDAEKLAGQGGEDSLVQKATQAGEQLLDTDTGGKFDSEIQDGGNLLDQQVDQDLPKL
jgi:hypothetical protein